MQLPRISIITPSYNQAEFLEKTINSVLSQHYPNLEYIIVDGGSSDGSVNIIRNYSSYLAWWVSESDGGQTNAINKGFKGANGEIIGWVNSDDMLTHNSLRRIGEDFINHPEIMAIYGDAQYIDKGGSIIQNYFSGDYSFERLIRSNFIRQPSVFFRREIFNIVGYLDETLHYAMDYDLWMRIATRYPLDYKNEFLSQLRFYPGTKTSQGRLQFSLDIIHIYQKIVQDNESELGIKELALTSCLWRALEITHFVDNNPNFLKFVQNDTHIIEEFTQFQSKIWNLYILITSSECSSSFCEKFETELISLYLSILSDRHSSINTIRRNEWIQSQYLWIIRYLFTNGHKKQYFSMINIISQVFLKKTRNIVKFLYQSDY